MIANKEFDNEPFYEKMLSFTCYRLLDYDDSINDFTDDILASLCVEIDSYDIENDDKQLLQVLLQKSVEPKLKKQIDAYISHNKREKSENKNDTYNSDSTDAKPE